MSCTILYSTYYGSTRQYAEALAKQLNTTAQQIPDAPALNGPTVILAPAHGPLHDGVKLIKQLDPNQVEQIPIALVTVGMTIDEEVEKADATGKLLGGLAPHVKRFYLPGRLNYSQLNVQHKGVMRTLITALKIKPRKSDNERNMIDTYGKDVDRVDLARLEPIVDWANKQQAT
ncbi:flavodoxin domain-containing protein [Corynebacterium riegelii]|uniref:Flavodoxin domain-containing protein n=1 Tax=Corynebacterium riegelii TaxID=156976 RepID=A0A0K1RDI1_9CORY|nr:flavodoxin domain-containing protein [Corynebacterium riegelii]AKV59453.1 hypothetical protein AK829_10280 [Corynebacterium riegelii]